MEAIKNRIAKNYKHRKKWARKQNIEAYRIYDREIPEYPYMVDIYGEYAVIFDRTNKKIDADKAHHYDHLVEALKSVLEIEDDKIITKRREVQKGIDQYKKLDRSMNTIVVKENQASFIINLHDYLDMGLFLDHRPIRQKIHAQAAGKSVLNLFSYTSSISVFAALGGAKTTSVDMSKTYLAWSQENFEENGIELDNHQFVNASVLDYLAERVSDKYDLIFLDPPTFSNSKKMENTFDVERDQDILIKGCMKRLNDGGVLYFSNNKRDFKLSEKTKENYLVKDISYASIPDDFKDKKIHVCFEIKHKI